MNETCLGNAKQASIELKTLLVCSNLDIAIQAVNKKPNSISVNVCTHNK